MRFFCCYSKDLVYNRLRSLSDIPYNEYHEYFGPDYQLDVRSSNMEDLNTPAYLNRVKGMVMTSLRSLGGPPSVQMMGNFTYFLFV